MTMSIFKKIALFFFILTWQIAALKQKISCDACARSPSKLGEYQEVIIASDAPGCASQGKRAFDRGGNAIDSIIVTALCNGLVSMYSMGVGADFFMVYYKANENRSYVLDGRNEAPLNATEDMFVNIEPNQRKVSPLTIAVSNILKGYHMAWTRFGKLPWNSLFVDSITMARNGIPVVPLVAKTIQRVKRLFDYPELIELRRLLYNETAGRFKQAGDTITRPKLADYLQRVADNPNDLLTGNLLTEVAADLKEVGSIITLKDLVDYSPIWKDTLQMSIRKGEDKNAFQLHGLYPPSSGVLVGLALNMLSKYNYTQPADIMCHDRGLFYHRLLETYKFIFAKRSFLKDDRFMSIDEKEFVQKLKTMEYADELQSLITDNETHPLKYYGSVFDPAHDHGTAHISLIAPNGDAVALTASDNTEFGSGLIGSRTGILFNNGMLDFSTPDSADEYQIPASPANLISPGKRPISSMSPLIILDTKTKRVRLVVGGSGGSKIITAVILSSFGILHSEMDPKCAVDIPRLHHQLLPDFVLFDDGFPESVLEELRQRGHFINTTLGRSVVQAVEIVDQKCSWMPDENRCFKRTGQSSILEYFTNNGNRNRCLRGNADFRKGGEVDGY